MDVVIPRGSGRLIQAVVGNASVPVIETGVGVCHTFVDAGADYGMAEAIIINAKTQRPGVCNAMETLLVHKGAVQEFLPHMLQALKEKGVQIIGDETVCAMDKEALPATEEDWATEYGDLRLSVKVVENTDEAIEHINKYGTKHSECIVTRSLRIRQRVHPLYGRIPVWLRGGDRYQHTEITCPGSHGPAGINHLQIFNQWRRTG